MTTQHAAVRVAAGWLGVREGMLWPCAYPGAVEDAKRNATQRSPRWMEPRWEGTTTAAQQEARKEAISELLRALVEDSRRSVQRSEAGIARPAKRWVRREHHM